MELLLNLVWAGLACFSLLAWVVWRKRSDSESVSNLSRGIMVIVCALALLFPVISMSDDLSQAAVLAEGNKVQDTLKSSVSRQLVTVVLFCEITSLAAPLFSVASEGPRFSGLTVSLYDSFSLPRLAKRPPPRSL